MENRKRKKDKGVMGLLLILAWLLFILMAVCFYIFFIGNGKKDKKDNDNGEVTTETQTKFTYKTNANVNINALIGDYYTALVTCNEDELKACVTNPSQFNDMSYYESLSKIIVGYSNINCYSVTGFTEDATLVYVTSNVEIAGIATKPLDIQTFYIIKSGKNYKIYNETYSKEISDYIEKVQADDDIQNLYRVVRNNVEDCKRKDDKFKDLWNTLYGE